MPNPNTEMGPVEYKNKHQKGITLDTYNGIANETMILNAPLADRFMQVSDMRSDIAIIQKPQDRVKDYEDVGFVKVAKFLKMPRLDVWGGKDAITQVRKENDTWLVAVNDQDLADKVSRIDNGKKFNERFVNAFNAEINQGLVTCLKREKFLNSGKYNVTFLTGYLNLGYDISMISLMLTAAIIARDFSITPLITVAGLSQSALFNLLCNFLNWEHTEKNPINQLLRTTRRSIIDYNEPFVKHSPPEFLLPSIPIDRYFRGCSYLQNHGNDLITIG